MKRLLPFAAVVIFATVRLTAAESLELDASENLFYVMAAINAAGYDDGINLPDNNPIRLQLRDYLAKQNIPVLPSIRDFYRRQMRGNKSATEDLAPFLSWALSVTGAPDFRWKGRDIDVPPDALRLGAFTPLMIDFYQQARERGIKPILGCEVYVAPGSRLEKKAGSGSRDVYHHLVLLAKDEAGYKNLIQLVTDAHLKGYYYKPRIDKELLALHKEGLIALSGPPSKRNLSGSTLKNSRNCFHSSDRPIFLPSVLPVSQKISGSSRFRSAPCIKNFVPSLTQK